MTDDGAGFDPRLAEGKGLGLASMRQRAAAAGGTIQVASAPGQGTTVRLEAPVRHAMIRVLIVDDHPVVRQGLVALLSVQDDIAVAGEAGDGPAAVALAGSASPDVVLLDLKLPGMDGVAVLRELAGTRRVLVLTSATDPHWADRALKEGASGVVYKDIDPDALVRAIRSVHDGNVLLAVGAAASLRGGSRWP